MPKLPDNDSLEQKWNRLQKIVQHDILTNYPNPLRKDCPGLPTLRTLARRNHQFDATIEQDPHWLHVVHCSPCYADYLKEFRSHRRRTTKSTSPEKP